METTELTITEEQKPILQQEVLTPMSPVDAKQEMELYQQYQQALLIPSDYQDIQGKKFKKKSAWRKLARAMRISVETKKSSREELPNGDYAYHFDCEATLPNGQFMPGSGSCTAYEKAQWKDGKWLNIKGYVVEPNSLHNIRSTAETRATNRAISNLVAAGEVSAEEVDQGQHHAVTTQTKPLQAPVVTQQAQPSTEEPRCPKCNGAMWDCRTIADGGTGKYPKTNPKAPDWKCKNKENCDGLIWKIEKKDITTTADSPDGAPDISVEDIPF